MRALADASLRYNRLLEQPATTAAVVAGFSRPLLSSYPLDGAEYPPNGKEIEMDEGKPKTGKVVGWGCLGFSIVLMIIFILKSAAGRDVSPALLVVGMALLVIGITRLASAKKMSQK